MKFVCVKGIPALTGNEVHLCKSNKLGLDLVSEFCLFATLLSYWKDSLKTTSIYKAEEEETDVQASFIPTHQWYQTVKVDLWATPRRTPAERDQHLSSETCYRNRSFSSTA
ncbi:unnamed protein product [Victoria cruziana]